MNSLELISSQDTNPRSLQYDGLDIKTLELALLTLNSPFHSLTTEDVTGLTRLFCDKLFSTLSPRHLVSIEYGLRPFYKSSTYQHLINLQQNCQASSEYFDDSKFASKTTFKCWNEWDTQRLESLSTKLSSSKQQESATNNTHNHHHFVMIQFLQANHCFPDSKSSNNASSNQQKSVLFTISTDGKSEKKFSIQTPSTKSSSENSSQVKFDPNSFTFYIPISSHGIEKLSNNSSSPSQSSASSSPSTSSSSSSKGKRQSSNEKQSKAKPSSSPCDITIKLIDESQVGSFSSGTIAKLTLKPSDYLLLEIEDPEWKTFESKSKSSNHFPQVQMRIATIGPTSEKISLNVPYSWDIASCYNRLALKLAGYNVESRRDSTTTPWLTRHFPTVLDSFSKLFGVTNFRKHITNIECLMLYGETRGALDQISRAVSQMNAKYTIQPTDPSSEKLSRQQNVRSSDPSRSKSPDNSSHGISLLFSTISEDVMYTILKPKIYLFASQLVNRCTEVFPKNSPYGTLKRAFNLLKLVAESPESISSSIGSGIQFIASKTFSSKLYPTTTFSDSVFVPKIASWNINNINFNTDLWGTPPAVPCFSNILDCIADMKCHVDVYLGYFQSEFIQEMQLDPVQVLVDTFIGMLNPALRIYFAEHSKINSTSLYGITESKKNSRTESSGTSSLNRSTSSTAGVESHSLTDEYSLIFSSIDQFRWIIKHWQKYTKKDLRIEIPIFDYMEFGLKWWLDSLEAQLVLWSASVLTVDDFTPIDSSSKQFHSQSVTNLFSISHQALDVITPVLSKWNNSKVFSMLEQFIKSFCKSVAVYAANVEVEFNKITSSETMRSKIPPARLAHIRNSVANGGSGSKFTPPVQIKAIFAPLANKLPITKELQKVLRTTEDPALLVPEDLRFTVTVKLCVQMNNVEIVRQLLGERSEVLYQVYASLWDRNYGPYAENNMKTLTPKSNTNADDHPKKIDEDTWIHERFKESLGILRGFSESLIHALVMGLMPFIESNIFFIIRVHRDDDGKVRNESARIMSKVMQKDKVSQADLSTQMAAVLDFLEDSLYVLSTNLYYTVLKRLLKRLWEAIIDSIEAALVPHNVKHCLKSEQIGMLMQIEQELFSFFTADGEGLDAKFAQEHISSHQIYMACLPKDTPQIIQVVKEPSYHPKLRKMLVLLLQLRQDDGDKAAQNYFVQNANLLQEGGSGKLKS